MAVIRGTWMRGGTSKCWLFSAGEADRFDSGLEEILIEAFGAEDGRQLDGVGGGTSTTSKAAIVRRSDSADADVDYLFAQVAIGERRVEWGSNCGNCATAIGLYAVQQGLVECAADVTRVRMRNINTGSLLEAEVDTPGGMAAEFGLATIPGTQATGVSVKLVFRDPAGAATGTLFPTGAPSDLLGGHLGTLVDAGAPAALFDSAGFPANGRFEDLVPELIRLRHSAGVAMGLAAEDAPVSHAVPKMGIVGPPRDYTASDGTTVSAAGYDLKVSMVSMMAPHPAIGLTSAVAVAAASTNPLSVVSRHLRPEANRGLIRLGTPAGVISVGLRQEGGAPAEVSLYRAARRIAEAEITIPCSIRASIPSISNAARSAS